MKRLISVTLLTLLLAVCAQAQPQTVKPVQSGNAAMKYWQAFALLPTIDERQEKLLENWKTTPLDSEATKLLHGISPTKEVRADTKPLAGEATKLLQSASASLNYLHRAADCTHCNWDLDYDDGPGLLLPHLAKSRTLSRLALLQMRHLFAQKKPAEAVDTFLALISLVRQTGTDPILISILVGYRIEEDAIDAIAPYLPGLDKELLARLSSRMAAKPAMAQVQQAIATEKTYMNGWMIKMMEAAEKQNPGEWRKVLTSLFDSRAQENESNQKVLSSIDSFAKARQFSTDLMPVYDQLVQAFNLPYAEQTGRLDELMQQAKQNNPLATVLLPALKKTLAAQNRYRARQALFQAALVVVQKGPDQLKSVPDPFGNGPFEYKQLPQGFELTSKFRFADQPVSFTVGK